LAGIDDNTQLENTFLENEKYDTSKGLVNVKEEIATPSLMSMLAGQHKGESIADGEDELDILANEIMNLGVKNKKEKKSKIKPLKPKALKPIKEARDEDSKAISDDEAIEVKTSKKQD